MTFCDCSPITSVMSFLGQQAEVCGENSLVPIILSPGKGCVTGLPFLLCWGGMGNGQ